MPHQRWLCPILLLITLLSSGCSPSTDSSLQQLSGQTMGTTFTVSIVGEHQVMPAEITGILLDLEAGMSTYRDDSELMQLNRAPQDTWIAVSQPLFEVLALSQAISAFSEGAFDISIAPLVNLWGFGPQQRQQDSLPDSDSINALLADVGYEYLQLDPLQQAVMKTRNVQLDLSAIAKGYAADQVAALLDAQQLENYLVEIGGEIRSKGGNASGEPWRIAIEQPGNAGEREALQLIAVNSAGIATSGDYRNYFMLDGLRYSHTLNPDNGYPVNHALTSVTVIADSAARADALATAFLVMGESAARTLADNTGIAAYFVEQTADGYRESYSGAFEAYLSAGGMP